MQYGRNMRAQLLKAIRESGGFKTFNVSAGNIVIIRHLQQMEADGLLRRLDTAPPGHITYQLLQAALEHAPEAAPKHAPEAAPGAAAETATAE